MNPQAIKDTQEKKLTYELAQESLTFRMNNKKKKSFKCNNLKIKFCSFFEVTLCWRLSEFKEVRDKKLIMSEL